MNDENESSEMACGKYVKENDQNGAESRGLFRSVVWKNFNQ